MDVERLLTNRDGDGPSGDNLEYDLDFMALEVAAQPGEEQQVGDEVIAATEPDWSDVASKAEGILQRSHDLRAGVYLAAGLLNTKGLGAFAEATSYLRGCLERHWETCHPQLDADDDNDPTMRINSVQNLTGASVMKALRRAPLTDSRAFGRLSLRDLQIASGEISPADGENVDVSRVSAAFQDSDPEALAARLQTVRTILDNIKAIETKFAAETPGQGPDFDELTKALRTIAKKIGEFVSGDAASATAEAEPENEMQEQAPAARGGGGGGGGAAAMPVGSINSQRDVVSTIDKIISYYQRTEPSSPVPLLLERAKRLVGADFLSIVKDMAPRGVENVNLIGGLDDD